MLIQPATAADFPALDQIYRDVRRRHFTWFDPARIGDGDLERDSSGEKIYVARDTEAGDALGFISVWAPDRFVHHLYVDSAHQDRGVGRRLLEFCQGTYPPPLRLKCVERNERALRFYLRQGWRVVDRGLSEDGDYLLLEAPTDVRAP